MNTDELASFLMKAAQAPSEPSNSQPVPQPTSQPVNQTAPTQSKQNLQQFLEKYKQVLSPEDYKKVEHFAVQLQHKKIEKKQFEQEFQAIIAKYQRQQQTQNAPPKQYELQLSPELKELLALYSSTPKEKKAEFLQKNPEIVPILKKIVEQKKQTSQNAQTVPPQPQTLQNKPTPPIQNFTQPGNVPPQANAFQRATTNFPSTVPQNKTTQHQQLQQQQQQLQQQLQIQQQQQLQKNLVDQKLKNETQAKKQKGLPNESKKPGRPKQEEETDIDALNDVTKIAGVNLEDEDSLWDDNEELTEKHVFHKQPDFLNKGPLTNKIQLKANQMKLQDVSEDVYECVSLAVQERMYNILQDLVKISTHRHVKHDSKTITSKKEKTLYESVNALKETVKMIESEDKTEKKKVTKKSEKKVEEIEDYKTSSANMAAEMAIIGGFETSKKRKMNYEQKSTSSTPNSSNLESNAVNSATNPPKKQKKSTILLNDILLHMEREEKLKKSKLLHGVYLKRK